MQCPDCDVTNPSTNSFCGACGKELAQVCRQCGHTDKPGWRFCGQCGAAVDPPQQEKQFDLTPPPRQWAERKQGTVLFADVVGSTELIAELDPEQAMERLRPSLDLMSAAVTRFGGTVIHVLGDGIMAVFGAPRAQEAHALLACQSAMAIQRAVELGDRKIKVRIGLHSGELVLSQDSSGPDPTPHGAVIHMASRLEQMAEPGTICLTGECYQYVRAHCDVRSLGERAAKGFSKPIEAYALLSFKSAVASQQFRAISLTPFRGRDSELRDLLHALNRSENGEARVVGVSGAAGTGKSRLCYEFAEWCRRRFIPVFEARALVYGQATPLRPILEFVRLLLGISQASDDVTYDRISEHPFVSGLDPQTDLPLLCQFLGVNTPAGSPQIQDLGGNARLKEIVGHMVKQAGAKPIVIIFEDLHWLDAESAPFVAAIIKAIPGTQAMSVVNFRQTYTADWMDEPHYRQMPLGELDTGQIDVLVDHLIGGDPELRVIKQRINARCGGNPFFAEELVRSLVERGAICGSAGQYQRGPNADTHALPASVQAILAARIDELAGHDKNILHIAAIIGKEFSLDVIEEVAATDRKQIESSIDCLRDAGLIESRIDSVDQEFFFRHPLIEEVAYNEQLKSRRSRLHAAVAVALEHHYKSRIDEFSALIAYHYEAAGLKSEAAIFAAQAAVWIGSTASALALQQWHKVRQLIGSQPRSVIGENLILRASGQIAMFGWREGMTADEARPFIDEALVWARKLDNSMVSLLLAADGRIAVASGRSTDDYVARIKEGRAIEEQAANLGRTATLDAFLCHANLLAGLLPEALEANSRALQRAPTISKFDEQFLGLNVEQWMRGLRGRILVRLGKFDEAEKCLAEILKTDQSLIDPAVQFIPHLSLVDLSYFRGDPEMGRVHAECISQIAQKGQSPYLQVYALGCQGTANLIGNDFKNGARLLLEGIGFAQATKAALEFEPEMMASLSDCHLRSGDFDQAASVAQQTIDLAQQRGSRLAECRALVISAHAVFASHGACRKDEAIENLDRAESLIQATGAIAFSDRLARERAMILGCSRSSVG